MKDTIARTWIKGIKSALASSTGAGLIGLPFGGTVGDLGNAYRDAVFATTSTSVEAAHTQAVLTGKARVIVNGFAWVANGSVTTFTVPIEFTGGATCSANGYALNFTKGFRAGDYDAIFSPADANLLTFPVWQRLTPFHFGAKGDFVSAASPGTDDGDALNAWAGELCWRVMPTARYGTTKTIAWNGDSTSAGGVSVQVYGIRAEADAEIIQRTDNIPIMTFYGSRGEWLFPKLTFMNQQDTTMQSGIGLMTAVNPGQSGGFHTSAVPNLHIYQASTGIFFAPPIASTTAVAAASGATSVRVANAQTGLDGSYPWTPGMYVQIWSASANAWITTKITNVATDVLTLRDALTSNVASGAQVVVCQNKLVASTDVPATPTRFSNTWGRVYIECPTIWGIISRDIGTQDLWHNLYIKDARSNAANLLTTLKSAYYATSRNGDAFPGIINVEQFKFTGNAFDITADSVSFGSIHFEGCRLLPGAGALLSAAVSSLSIRLLQVHYCQMLSDDLSAATVGVLGPRAGTSTIYGGNRGVWTIGILDTGKNMITPANGFVARDNGQNQTRIKIKSWKRWRDAGFDPTRNLSYSQNYGVIVDIEGVLPRGAVAYRPNVDLTTAASQALWPCVDYYKINKVVAINPSASLTTATGGVWNESAGTNLVTASGTTALSPLTGPATIVEMALSSNETNKLRNGGGSGGGALTYWKTGTTQASPSAVTASSRYLTGRYGGNNNTNLAFINFASAHGFTVGQTVTITDDTVTALAGTFTITDVPSTTQIVVYCDSATASGTAAAPITTGTITVRLRPTAWIVAIGDDYGMMV